MKNKKVLSESGLPENHLLLHKEIYSRQALQQAVVAFGGLARISLSEEGEYYHLTFEEVRADITKMKNEFQNYVLIGTIQGMGELYD